MCHAIKSGLSRLFVVTALAAGPAMARDGRGHERDTDRGYDRYSYQDRGDRDYRRASR